MKLVTFFVCCCCLLPQEAEVDQQILKWEQDVSQLEAKDQTESAIENGILFYGSSSIRLWDTIVTDMKPWAAIQRGYGGAKLPDIIHYAPRLLGPHLGTSNPRRCKAIVLFVANDISGKAEEDATPVEVAGRFLKLKDWIREKDETLPVFWIEVTPTPKRWQVWPQIEDATSRIRQIIAGDPNCYLISTGGAILGGNGTPQTDLFVEDQLHLNSDGYRLWSALIKAELYAQLGAEIPFADTAQSGG